MRKIINYTLIITLISIFILVGDNNLSAAESAKKTTCPATKTIKNVKYICKIEADGRCVCRKAPLDSKTKNSIPAKQNSAKNNQQKKAVAKAPAKQPAKKQTTTQSSAKPSAKKATPKNTNTAKKAPVKTSQAKKTTPAKSSNKVATKPSVQANSKKNTTKPVAKTTPAVAPKVAPKVVPTTAVAKKSVAPLIFVNRFEEDPTFFASISGILYKINSDIKIIDVATTDASKDLIVQAYKLLKTSSMWGDNAVFISTSDKAKIEPTIIIVKSKNNQFFVTQDSGVITFIKDTIGIAEVRKAQRVNFMSETLNGRDVEYLIGAQLIDNPANFNKLGEPIEINTLSTFSYTPLQSTRNDISGLFIVEDKDNGNVFTFIPSEQFNKFNPKDNDIFEITLSNETSTLLKTKAIYKNSRTYIGGTEAIILNYKSSIGTYIAVKNIQNNALSTLPDSSKNYKIEITPIAKSHLVEIPIELSKPEPKVEPKPKSTQPKSTAKPVVHIKPIQYPKKTIDENAPLDEETSEQVPYATQREEKTADIIEEDVNQNPTEANIKDLQKEKSSVDGEIKKQEEQALIKSDANSNAKSDSKSIYPNAGRNNLSISPKPATDIEKEDLSIDEQNIQSDAQNNENFLDDGMIDEEDENNSEKGVLISKLSPQPAQTSAKTPAQSQIDNLESERAITSNDEMRNTLDNKNIRDAKRDSREISNIERDAANSRYKRNTDAPETKTTKY